MSHIYFIPNRRFYALAYAVARVCLIVAALLVVVTPAFAQEVPPAPGVPDLTPVIDDLSNQLNSFLTSAAVIMGVLAFLLTQAAKAIFPSTIIKTETIYAIVIFLGTVVFFVAQMLGAGEQLGKAVTIGTVIAETLKAILSMLIVPTVAYNYFERKGNPLAGGHQGNKWLSLQAPEPRTESTTADINISAKSTHDGAVGIASAKG